MSAILDAANAGIAERYAHPPAQGTGLSTYDRGNEAKKTAPAGRRRLTFAGDAVHAAACIPWRLQPSMGCIRPSLSPSYPLFDLNGLTRLVP